ncbi:MAG: D-lyxose/D-mannose family sugar isomerase, partial [Victivallales bacterium]|nr:D-lyxose/D-mannose family sugar isomerase [Victivallales bacterium]
HWNKMEDIINRGGGVLVVKLYNSTEDGEFADTLVDISMDGRNFRIPAGGEVRITPGESIMLPTGQYHSFWGEKGSGRILLGEVSKVNDDRVDNRFKDEVGRFPEIEEDEPPLYLLGNEYPAAKEL